MKEARNVVQVLEDLTIKELRELAISHNFKRWTQLSKSGLIDFLRERLAASESSASSSSSPKAVSTKNRSVPATDGATESEPEITAKPSERKKSERSARREVSVGKEEGQVVTLAVVEEVPARRRGRRTKSASQEAAPETIAPEPKKAEVVEASKASAPQKRRARKNAVPEVAQPEAIVEKKNDEEEITPEKKRRVRAVKKAKAEESADKVESPTKRNEPSATDAKTETKAAKTETEAAKSETKSAKSETKSAKSGYLFDIQESVSTKRRGRPRKNPISVVESAPAPVEKKKARGRKGRVAIDEDPVRIPEPIEKADDKEVKRTSASVPADGFGKSSLSDENARTLERREKIRARKVIGFSDDKRDSLVLSVCDPYWLRARWEATPQCTERVRSAMGRFWHTSDPILRLYRAYRDARPNTVGREFVADVEIRGDVDNWYIPVDEPPQSFMVELGYRTRDNRFYAMLSSNIVATPRPFGRGLFNRSGNALNSFAPFALANDLGPSSRRVPRGPSASLPSFGETSDPSNVFFGVGSLRFNIDTEVIVKGRVTPGASARIKDEPISIEPDGSFSIRFTLPERRHVFPIVATSSDGIEKQTIVLSIDRNTKALDPEYRDDEERS